jgi:hypothetical protein
MKLDLDDPIAVLLAAVDAFRAHALPAAAYGGLALAAYGEPRETKDADLAVASVGAETARDALVAAGLDASLTFNRVTFGGNFISRITLLPGDEATGLNTVDLVEPRSPRFARDAVERSIEGTLRGQSLHVLTPEDFILFKALSTRERDLEDAATVMRSLTERLDSELIDVEASRLAKEIADHDVIDHLRRIRALAG